MSAYTRDLRDVAFHCANAQRSLERAQATAPEQHRSAIDKLDAGLVEIRRWIRRAAVTVERRGGIRR